LRAQTGNVVADLVVPASVDAIHAKLDELLRAEGHARNELTTLDDQEPEEIKKHRDQERADSYASVIRSNTSCARGRRGTAFAILRISCARLRQCSASYRADVMPELCKQRG
jgi:hypothetical protein